MANKQRTYLRWQEQGGDDPTTNNYEHIFVDEIKGFHFSWKAIVAGMVFAIVT